MSDQDNKGKEPLHPGKLPARSSDWHSGLKSSEAAARPVAPGTVTDFIAGPDTGRRADWGTGDAEVVPVLDETEPETRRSFYTTGTRFTDKLLALLLAVIAFVAVATTYQGFGHSWDEALYLEPGTRAGAWMRGVFNNGDNTLLEPEAVARHWGGRLDDKDPLHPEVAPVPKHLIGAGLAYLQPLGVDPMTATRLPSAVLFGLTVGLLFLLGTREYGRIGGFAAAIFYLLTPRVFGHAHMAASETALAFFVVGTVWFFLVANRRWVLAVFTGIFLGLAISTKVTALLLPLPLMLWGQLYKRRDYASNVFAMAFIAPLMALAVWPWLWYGGLVKFFEYLMFYIYHQKTTVYYLGRMWGYIHGPSAPWFYPAHITAVVLPEWLLLFAGLGLFRALFGFIRRPATVLFVLLAASWIGLSSLPNAPRYDGERLFFPAFAFIALVGAAGFSGLFAALDWRRRRRDLPPTRDLSYGAAIGLLVIGCYGTADLYVSHPNQLNYFNWLVGRPAGAYRQGFETSYWGESLNEEATGWLQQNIKPGDKVKVLSLNGLAFKNLRQWGVLPQTADFNPPGPPYDYVIMQVRQGFMGRIERTLHRTAPKLKVIEAQGVPRLEIYDGDVLNQLEQPGLTKALATSRSLTLNSNTTATAANTTATAITTSTLATDPATTTMVVLDLASSGSETTSALVVTTVTVPIDLPPSSNSRFTTATEVYAVDVPTSAAAVVEQDVIRIDESTP